MGDVIIAGAGKPEIQARTHTMRGFLRVLAEAERKRHFVTSML